VCCLCCFLLDCAVIRFYHPSHRTVSRRLGNGSCGCYQRGQLLDGAVLVCLCPCVSIREAGVNMLVVGLNMLKPWLTCCVMLCSNSWPCTCNSACMLRDCFECSANASTAVSLSFLVLLTKHVTANLHYPADLLGCEVHHHLVLD